MKILKISFSSFPRCLKRCFSARVVCNLCRFWVCVFFYDWSVFSVNPWMHDIFSTKFATWVYFDPNFFYHDFGAEGKWNTNGANRYTLPSIKNESNISHKFLMYFKSIYYPCMHDIFATKFAPWGHFDPNFFSPWLKYEKKLWMSMLHTHRFLLFDINCLEQKYGINKCIE